MNLSPEDLKGLEWLERARDRDVLASLGSLGVQPETLNLIALRAQRRGESLGGYLSRLIAADWGNQNAWWRGRKHQAHPLTVRFLRE